MAREPEKKRKWRTIFVTGVLVLLGAVRLLEVYAGTARMP